MNGKEPVASYTKTNKQRRNLLYFRDKFLHQAFRIVLDK